MVHGPRRQDRDATGPRSFICAAQREHDHRRVSTVREPSPEVHKRSCKPNDQRTPSGLSSAAADRRKRIGQLDEWLLAALPRARSPCLPRPRRQNGQSRCAGTRPSLQLRRTRAGSRDRPVAPRKSPRRSPTAPWADPGTVLGRPFVLLAPGAGQVAAGLRRRSEVYGFDGVTTHHPHLEVPRWGRRHLPSRRHLMVSVTAATGGARGDGLADSGVPVGGTRRTGVR